jgi:hypothetical protein
MQERDLAMPRNEIRSYGDKGRNSSENNSTSCFDYLRNRFNPQKKEPSTSRRSDGQHMPFPNENNEISSSDGKSQKASSPNDASRPSPHPTETREKSAQQKRLDLGKFVIDRFKGKKFEKIKAHLEEINEQKQEIIEKLELSLSLGKEDIEKWKQAAENTKNQLEGYKSDLIHDALNEKYNKTLQEIVSKALTEEKKQDKWNEYEIISHTIDEIPEILKKLRQIPETLDKLLNELIPSQQQHLDRIKRGDSLNRYAGQDDLDDQTQKRIESVEIQKPTAKETYLISKRYCDQKNHLLDNSSDNTNLSAPIGILNYIKEINSISDIITSSESQNEITDTKPGHSVEMAYQSCTPQESQKPQIVNPSDSYSHEKHNQDAGPSQPPEFQLDLLSKLTEINKLPTYIDQLVQQYERFGEVTNKLERIEAAHNKYIQILNDEKKKLCKQLGKSEN